MNSNPVESTRINLRTSPEAKAMIERAAALVGTSVSGFMLHNAYEAARRIVMENDLLVLCGQQFDRGRHQIRRSNSRRASVGTGGVSKAAANASKSRCESTSRSFSMTIRRAAS